MMGEELNAAEITERGLLGDRAYALVDSAVEGLDYRDTVTDFNLPETKPCLMRAMP